MRGGTGNIDASKLNGLGLSPHARGNPGWCRQSELRAGPIPACAGEPFLSSKHTLLMGAYPRMRGGTRQARLALLEAGGLSPHARGNPGSCTLPIRSSGPIPACAGEPLGLIERQYLAGAYPRMRGGTFAIPQEQSPAVGLSPHARGNPLMVKSPVAAMGPIPACAGEPAGASVWVANPPAYPRMRGGTASTTG